MVSWHLRGSVDATLTAVFKTKAGGGGGWLVSSGCERRETRVTKSLTETNKNHDFRGERTCAGGFKSKDVANQASCCAEHPPTVRVRETTSNGDKQEAFSTGKPAVLPHDMTRPASNRPDLKQNAS